MNGLAISLWPGQWLPSDALATLAFAILVALAHAHPANGPGGRVAPLTSVLLLAAILVVPLPHAVVAALAGTLLAEAWMRRQPSASALHLGATGAAVALASAAYHSLAPSTFHLELSAFGLGYAAGAYAVFRVVHVATLAAGAQLTGGQGCGYQWARMGVMDLVAASGAVALGYSVAVLAVQAWWGPLILASLLPVAWTISARNAREKERSSQRIRELMTQIRELKAARNESLASAERVSIKALAAGLSHEINNPLFAILGRADVLLQYPDRHLANEVARQSLLAIRDSSMQAATVVRNVQTSADRLQSPGDSLSPRVSEPTGAGRP